MGATSIGGFGNQVERDALLTAANQGQGFGQLSYGNETIEYLISTDADGNISAFDQSSGNIIGVFQKDNNNNLVFAENPDYFGEAN